MTDGGRTVYGGGGISPDEKYTPPKLDKFQADLLRQTEFFNFTSFYFGTHSIKLPDNWAPDAAVVDAFHEYLMNHKVVFTEADFTQHMDWIKHSLQHEMTFTANSSEDSRVFDVKTDPAVAKAEEALPKAQTLLNSAKKIIVQRMAK